MNFTVTLNDDDWDTLRGGWRCPALQIPGTEVVEIFATGSVVDPKQFSINRELLLVRWANRNRPRQVAVQIALSKALSTQELTARWKKLAILLPIVGSIATALVSVYARETPVPTLVQTAAKQPADNSASIGLVRQFAKSNDFLSSSTRDSFEAALTNAKREVWFVGTSFYISADTYRDLIRKRVQDGVDVNFLILDPDGGNLERAARMMNISVKELADQCHAGIRTFMQIRRELAVSGMENRLGIRLSSDELYSRLYFFDPKADEGLTYFIPQVNRASSQVLPGFLVRNAQATFHSSYFDGIQRLWNAGESSGTRTLESWLAHHREFH